MAVKTKTHNTHSRLDSGESALFARQLEVVAARTYNIKTPTYKAFQIIPFKDDIHPGATQYTYRRFTDAGNAKIIADDADDLPRVDIYGEEITVKLRNIGDSFGYNIQEIRSSQLARLPLDHLRAQAAIHKMDKRINHTALFGSPEHEMHGLFNFPGITETVIPDDGTGGSRSWKTKSVDQIIRDVNIILDSVVLPTDGEEQPDTLLLPLSALRELKNRRLGDNDITLLKYIRDNYPELTTITYLNELAAAGREGTTRAMAGKFDDGHLEIKMPVYAQFEDPERRGFSYRVDCTSRISGLIVYYPMAFGYADGI
jgi:hypothetical protein